ncbi:hypothetical protein C1N80_06115 [Brachybacterium sp. SGAir0954]|uniref:peptidoglycan-binding domain-containing protein n=1 Tax=Brachybacterium sp. SGAir0954 TaxID=2571029 RepID=UPI0010CD5B2E|nr:peptidoglycan-binding protein [Brachybacterium sp. SGAir0954]QCR53195.1 hypothetical protein C1N80_06115 [Brachybacterium sp. SGAir0954]
MKDFATARADYISWHQDQLRKGPWEVPAGSNRNRYSRSLGRPAQAWCVDYAQAGLEATGSGGGIIPTASTRAHIAWAKTTGRYRSRNRPALGALAAVAKNGTSVHTDGCVVKASTSRLLAIGGNTSNRGGSTADGGGVYLNDRTYMLGSGTYRIYGYTVPFFGLTREDVLEIQGKLGVTRTGYMTAATVAAVRAFQKRSGLVADGFPGPTTFSALTLGSGGGKGAAAKPAASSTSSRLAEDGIFGTASAKALEGRLGLKQDGALDAADIRAWQKHEGTFVDGVISGQVTAIDRAFPAVKDSQITRGGGGSNLLRAVQRNLNVTPVDGYGGHDLAKAMQHAINTNPTAFKAKG